MKDKAFWGTALTVAWIVVFTISSAYGLFVAPPYRTFVEGVPLYVSYFTVVNAIPMGLILLFLHYLIFTNQANSKTVSDTAVTFLCWSMLMLFDAVDPAWWITRVLALGIFVLFLEMRVPNWPHRLTEFLKKKFPKKENGELPKTQPNDDRLYK